ncbi:MAG: tRNA (guanine-N7)-methyltransferase [Rickettsiales bacterium]|jgi:tRNA (guanine-N7-)-methyltransferase|nr:tRNA (guanine-N7)-methyltransferase [Rickettsiales bacterium]
MENQDIRTFGRRHGKKLSTRQQWLVDNLLPALAHTDTETDTILEIGFGAGEHLMYLAQHNPDKIIIGAEPFINGVASLLANITDAQNLVKNEYKNIRIYPDDVRKFFIENKNFSPEKIYILHPDPWPKARHEKRRLLNTEFIKLLLTHSGAGLKEIIIATDHLDYASWIEEQIKKINNAKYEISDIAPQGGLNTRYHNKDMFGANKTKYIILSPK